MAPSLSSQLYAECKMIRHSSSLFLVGNEIVSIQFPGKYLEWSFRISCGQFARFAYSPARKVHKFFLININEELNSECLLNFSTWSSLIRHLLKTATSSRSFSILSSNSWWEMCSSGNKTRSVRPGVKYRSIRQTKISEIQTGNFGRMERALNYCCYQMMSRERKLVQRLVNDLFLSRLSKLITIPDWCTAGSATVCKDGLSKMERRISVGIFQPKYVDHLQGRFWTFSGQKKPKRTYTHSFTLLFQLLFFILCKK